MAEPVDSGTVVGAVNGLVPSPAGGCWPLVHSWGKEVAEEECDIFQQEVSFARSGLHSHPEEL